MEAQFVQQQTGGGGSWWSGLLKLVGQGSRSKRENLGHSFFFSDWQTRIWVDTWNSQTFHDWQALNSLGRIHMLARLLYCHPGSSFSLKFRQNWSDRAQKQANQSHAQQPRPWKKVRLENKAKSGLKPETRARVGRNKPAVQNRTTTILNTDPTPTVQGSKLKCIVRQHKFGSGATGRVSPRRHKLY